MLYKFAFLMVFLGAVSTHLMGQIVLPGTYEDDYRRLSLAKADSNQWLAYYPAVELPGFSKESNFKWVDPMLIMSFNSHFMKGTNDGPVWKGKGLTSAFYAGFQWRKGIFHASFAPVLYHSQNKDLPLAPLTDGKDPLNYQFAIQGSIDYVQRYG
ncbi:MAG: hypothetical protein KI790_15305, partial [Cyclobacteriaceae bacterium]|nr:hypothetical protein [Cyclobacteriaceae bacterium HetDA_MAG_MS6]